VSAKRPGDPFVGEGRGVGSPARDRTDATRRLQALTDRELEVLELLSTGASGKAIADQLAIKHATVKQHLRNIYLKLAATNRVQATRCYLLAHPEPPAARRTKRPRPPR
jgi:DNA-binding NarL/FixJ family response regulator